NKANVTFERSQELKDSLEMLSVPYESLQTTSLSSHTSLTSQSSQLPSYWKANYSAPDDGLKVFLPQLTATNSMPVLTILEGLIISSQDSFHTLVITFAVIVFNKIVTALAISCEIAERTHCKVMPVSTIFSFSLLPALGFLIVVAFDHILFVDTNEKRISALILSVVSSASVLQIIIISIRNNYMQFVVPQRNAIVQH